MSRLSSFVLGVVVGGAGVYGSLNYHVLRTNEGIQFVPKLTSSFDETYLDVRNFKTSDWNEHRSLLAAIVRSKKHTTILKDSSVDSLTDGVESFLSELGLSASANSGTTSRR